MGWADPANWARLSPRKRRAKIGPKWLGRTRHIIFFSLLGWAGPNPYIWSGPNQVRPISHINYFCRNMNRYCSRSACNQTVAEAVGGRRRRLPSRWSRMWWGGWVDGPGGGVARNGGRVGGQWQRKQKKKKKTGGAAERREKGSRWLSVVGWWLPVVELMVERPVMRVVVAEGHGGERKKRMDRLQENWARKAGFSQCLDPIFFSLRPSTETLFIDGGRG